MGLQPPDANWYMDTGATSHMTNDSGTLRAYLNSSTLPVIYVGNGKSIPVVGSGTATLNSIDPLHLKNVLHVPDIIKNLVSVRKFTIDNSASVQFDPCGFTVKDFKTERPILRCNSSGELYPITTTLASSSVSPTALVSVQ